MANATQSKSTHNLGQGFVAGVGIELELHECGECGVIWGMTVGYIEARRRDHKGWKCPNGHSWVFGGESDLEQERRLRQQAEQRAQARLELLEHEQHSHRATRGHLTRVRNERARLIARVANGVCPCCHRTFKQLARHMTAKHPDYLDEATAEA